MTARKKTCYVSIPFGTKPRRDGSGVIDFNAVYAEAIKPAVEAAGLACYRGDEPQLGGIIHRTISRLVADSDVMVADITTNNPNVLYEIGLRHALRRRVTVVIGAEWETIPYHLRELSRTAYPLAGETPTPDERQRTIAGLSKVLKARVKLTDTDSPVHDAGLLGRGASLTELITLPPQHLRYEAKLQEFRRDADFDRSVFIMTKFPEGSGPKDAALKRVIATVTSSIKASGFIPRIATDRTYFEDIWSNVELFLLGCRYGVAIVEGRYRPELNPNVAMEWGWMRGLGKEVLFLVEARAHKYLRADWAGLHRREFSWNEPGKTIPPHVRDWLNTRVMG